MYNLLKEKQVYPKKFLRISARARLTQRKLLRIEKTFTIFKNVYYDELEPPRGFRGRPWLKRGKSRLTLRRLERVKWRAIVH